MGQGEAGRYSRTFPSLCLFCSFRLLSSLRSRQANERALPVTTACDCAGITSPMLGGGHGWLQGQHGLLTDNILSARVVLADGTAVTASPAVNSDLFWALRGAGHNFGIVISVEYRIFDVEPGQARVWAYEEYVFRQDKLEALFGWANELLRDDMGSPRPVELTHYGQFQFRPDVDAENVSTLTLVRFFGWKWGHEQLILTCLEIKSQLSCSGLYGRAVALFRQRIRIAPAPCFP